LASSPVKAFNRATGKLANWQTKGSILRILPKKSIYEVGIKFYTAFQKAFMLAAISAMRKEGKK